MASTTIQMPFPSDSVQIWKYTGVISTGDVFTLSNNFRGLMFITDSTTERDMLILLSTTSNGTVQCAEIYVGTSLTLVTNVANKLTINHTNGGLTCIVFIARGSISGATA